MSSIAYITDSKLLELHRLNNHQTMNFWRLSNKTNFSDFGIDDLVFFLSKDKKQMKNKEKAVVGFGRCKAIHLNTIKYLWNKYGIYNGYNSYEEFKKAILKVCKDKKLPKKISSFYLEDVYYFWPIYLSEFDKKISNKTESYVYIDDKTNLALLNYAKNNPDLWTNSNEEKIEREIILTKLFIIHKKVGDIVMPESINKKGNKKLKNIEGYSFIQGSKMEIYKFDNRSLDIIFYKDNKVDYRLLLGQRDIYLDYLKDDIKNITFHYLDSEERISLLENKY